jgi:Holliday junction DNA helicase RuvA
VIAYLQGKLVEKNPTQLILDVNGIGYSVKIPLSSYDKLGDEGSLTRILTYQYVREDALQLYGFATEAEKDLFELLISVSGVGPKMALGILSCISVEDFQNSVACEDLDMLTSISGVGKKTAQRLIVELKEKLTGFELGGGRKLTGRKRSEFLLHEEAVKALVSLGFNKLKAREAVQKAQEETKGTPALEDLIKKSFRYAR